MTLKISCLGTWYANHVAEDCTNSQQKTSTPNSPQQCEPEVTRSDLQEVDLRRAILEQRLHKARERSRETKEELERRNLVLSEKEDEVLEQKDRLKILREEEKQLTVSWHTAKRMWTHARDVAERAEEDLVEFNMEMETEESVMEESTSEVDLT